MFEVEKRIKNALGRAGVLRTSHGKINTPAFATVATKGVVKALTVEQVKEALGQVILANTYHLHLEPGEEIIKKAGGLHNFSNWHGPIITDSGGFQVFSLGAAFDPPAPGGAQRANRKISKISKTPVDEEILEDSNKQRKKHVFIDENGVTFRNPKDGRTYNLTPEKSVEIQHKLGSDIMFVFDECTSPLSSWEYQKEAMERTERWAKRSLYYHKHQNQGKLIRFTKNLLKVKEEEKPHKQYLFGIVQGGRFEDLRKESAKAISKMDFDGFGIGGSFEKKDINEALRWVNRILPEEKPRHLLGIGEPLDILLAVENGADLFDCVSPTRIGRNGTLYTEKGKINITNAKYKADFSKIGENCQCYTCQSYSKAYLTHLFKAHEMLAATLASIHNLYFINSLLEKTRQHIIEGTFQKFKERFMAQYKS